MFLIHINAPKRYGGLTLGILKLSSFRRSLFLVKLFIFLMAFTDLELHGANKGPIWGRQYPSGPHVGPMNLAIRELVNMLYARNRTLSVSKIWKEVSACVPWRHSNWFLLVDTSEKIPMLLWSYWNSKYLHPELSWPRDRLSSMLMVPTTRDLTAPPTPGWRWGTSDKI